MISQILGYALSKYVGIKVCSKSVLSSVRVLCWGLSSPVNWPWCCSHFYRIPGSALRYFSMDSLLEWSGVWSYGIWREGEVRKCFWPGSAALLLFQRDRQGFRTCDDGRRGGKGLVLGACRRSIDYASQMGQVSESWMPAAVGLHFLPVSFSFCVVVEPTASSQ